MTRKWMIWHQSIRSVHKLIFNNIYFDTKIICFEDKRFFFLCIFYWFKFSHISWTNLIKMEMEIACYDMHISGLAQSTRGSYNHTISWLNFVYWPTEMKMVVWYTHWDYAIHRMRGNGNFCNIYILYIKH